MLAVHCSSEMSDAQPAAQQQSSGRLHAASQVTLHNSSARGVSQQPHMAKVAAAVVAADVFAFALSGVTDCFAIRAVRSK